MTTGPWGQSPPALFHSGSVKDSTTGWASEGRAGVLSVFFQIWFPRRQGVAIKAAVPRTRQFIQPDQGHAHDAPHCVRFEMEIDTLKRIVRRGCGRTLQSANGNHHSISGRDHDPPAVHLLKFSVSDHDGAMTVNSIPGLSSATFALL